MDQVAFNLPRGFRVGNYALERSLGAGCTAEAYLAREVPTGAVRVVKFYELHEDNQRIRNIRDFEHFCWLLEQVSSAQVLPRYHHMGHVFLQRLDGIGTYFMVQEYLRGKKFAAASCARAMIADFHQRVERVHKLGYALGDWEPENLLIVGGSIRMVDCDYGSFDKPNTRFGADLKAIEGLFSTRKPSKRRK